MLINFGFEEVNEAVIRNAQIWRYKKLIGNAEEIIVLVPEVFAGLYYHADKIVTFKQMAVKKYSDISDFIPNKTVLRWYAILDRCHKFFYKLSYTRGLSYSLFRRTPRQDFFYIKSGLERKLLKKCEEKFGKCKYIRMSDYYDLSTLKPVSPNLTEWFVTNLEYIEQMISAGDVYQVQKKCGNLAKPLVVLRTRNFKNKAIIHNSKKSILFPLISELLKFDCEIINIGTPHLPLDIDHPNYKEYAHDMSISEEFELCGKAACTIVTTEAGNFMGISATDLRIVQYDDEVFERLFKKPLSLFNARKKAGLDDLDIRNYVQSEAWATAAKLIYEFAINEKLIIEEKRTFSLPKRVDFGLV